MSSKYHILLLAPIKTAEAYARVEIALTDGFISCWNEKYRSKLLRGRKVGNRVNEHLTTEIK